MAGNDCNDALAPFGYNRAALKRFPKDCIDLTIDYMNARHADLVLPSIRDQFVEGSMHPSMRKHCFGMVYKLGKQTEFSRQNIKLFDCFEKTLCSIKNTQCYEDITRSFKEDLLKIVFGCNKREISWSQVVLSIVMTATYIRHASDGNHSQKLILALLFGLYLALNQLLEAVRCLDGWHCFVGQQIKSNSRFDFGNQSCETDSLGSSSRMCPPTKFKANGWPKIRSKSCPAKDDLGFLGMPTSTTACYEKPFSMSFRKSDNEKNCFEKSDYTTDCRTNSYNSLKKTRSRWLSSDACGNSTKSAFFSATEPESSFFSFQQSSRKHTPSPSPDRRECDPCNTAPKEQRIFGNWFAQTPELPQKGRSRKDFQNDCFSNEPRISSPQRSRRSRCPSPVSDKLDLLDCGPCPLTLSPPASNQCKPFLIKKCPQPKFPPCAPRDDSPPPTPRNFCQSVSPTRSPVNRSNKSRLTFGQEGKELILNMLEEKTCLSVPRDCALDSCQRQAIHARNSSICILLSRPELFRVGIYEHVLKNLISLHREFSECNTPRDEQVCKYKETFLRCLNLLPICKWKAVAAVFGLLHDLVCRVRLNSCDLQTLGDAVYRAFVACESEIICTLGDWDNFEDFTVKCW